MFKTQLFKYKKLIIFFLLSVSIRIIIRWNVNFRVYFCFCVINTTTNIVMRYCYVFGCVVVVCSFFLGGRGEDS